MMIGNGLQGTLLGVRAGFEGFPTALTGLLMSGYFAGFLVGSYITPKLVDRVGHIRVYAALASLSSIAVLLHVIYIDPYAWTLMRLITGFCFAGLYVTVESWLNDVSTNKTRGMLLSFYLFLTYGGVVLGQLMLNLADPRGAELFILSSILVSLALVPILLTVSPAPAVVERERLGFMEIYKISPLGVLGSMITGTIMGTLFGFEAVFAQAQGLDVKQISILLAVTYIGGTLSQIPIGRISDGMDRRYVIVACSVLSGIAALGAIYNLGGPVISLYISFTVLGIFILPLYSLLIAHANDHLRPNQMVAASSVLVMSGGIGAIFGPLLASAAMTARGPVGFLWLLTTLVSLLTIYTLYRLSRSSVSLEDQPLYVPVSQKLTSVGTAISQQAVSEELIADMTQKPSE